MKIVAIVSGGLDSMCYLSKYAHGEKVFWIMKDYDELTKKYSARGDR